MLDKIKLLIDISVLNDRNIIDRCLAAAHLFRQRLFVGEFIQDNGGVHIDPVVAQQLSKTCIERHEGRTLTHLHLLLGRHLLFKGVLKYGQVGSPHQGLVDLIQREVAEIFCGPGNHQTLEAFGDAAGFERNRFQRIIL